MNTTPERVALGPHELPACLQAEASDNAGRLPKKRYWEVRELVVIGVFAALTKVMTILVALVGGGMNPLTLVLKNLLFTTLLVVLLFKVRKPGVLLLFVLVSTLVSMLLMGGGLFLLPVMGLAGILAEGCLLLLGGYRHAWAIIVGVAVYDLSFKLGSLGLTWVFVREQPEMLYFTVVMVAIGYLGAVLGLVTGPLFVKELRHAGIVRE